MLNCKYCGIECKNVSGLHFHENRCIKNPNRIIYITKVKLCVVYNEEGFKKINKNQLVEYLNKGYKRGYGPTKNKSNNIKGKKWITNGIKNLQWDPLYSLPVGYKYGITSKSNTGICSNPINERKRRKKISETSKRNKKSGGYRIGSGHGKKGKYQGIYCDSTWELAYLIYCKDHLIQIERNTKRLEYTYNNEIHYYLPDFLVEGKLIEIKGWKDNKWKAKEEKYKDKIKIIDKNEIKKYIDYVINTYNVNDLTQLYD